MARRLTNARRQQALLRKLERDYRNRLASEIARASRLMLDKYSFTGSIPPLPDEMVPRLTELWRDMARASIEAFGGDVLDQGKALGHKIETKSFREFFLRLAGDWIAGEIIRRRITSVAETTRAQIVTQVRMGQTEGLGVAQIAKRIADSIPGISKRRGALIARTETHGAANFGAQQAAAATGFKMQKEWVAAEDERTRPAHAEANGQVVDVNQPFTVDGELLMYPGDQAGSAGNTINCRCTLAYIAQD
jgi:uncharacterized protein with gpF-like domain